MLKLVKDVTMKMQYVNQEKKLRTPRSLFGFNANEFETLLPSLGRVWDTFVRKQAGRAFKSEAVVWSRANRKLRYVS